MQIQDIVSYLIIKPDFQSLHTLSTTIHVFIKHKHYQNLKMFISD
uniref:Uncharacterized protein n=1 Tax=Anguilla anguilla TaxID=7936 RepID=A0A0E9U4U5_ANGAN